MALKVLWKFSVLTGIGPLSGPVLRDTARLSQRYPPIARYGVFQNLVSQHGQLGAIPAPLFLSVSPLERMRSGGAIPPHSKGVSQRYLRDTLWKQGKMGAIPPSATLSRTGIARYGGASRTGPLSWSIECSSLPLKPHYKAPLSFLESFWEPSASPSESTLLSEGEKPPKIRKKSSQEQSSWELLALLPLKRQRK